MNDNHQTVQETNLSDSIEPTNSPNLSHNKSGNSSSLVDAEQQDNANQSPTQPGLSVEDEEEQRQREANEDTTGSEDVRLFLKQMHQLKKDEEQQLQTAADTQTPIIINPSASFMGHPAGTVLQLEPDSNRQHVVRYPSAAHISHKTPHVQQQQQYRVSLTDLTSPESVPDGGWGWLVVFTSFFCMMLVDGVCLSYGLLLCPRCPYTSLHVISVQRTLPNQNTNVQERVGRPVWGSCIPLSDLGEDLGTQKRTLLFIPPALILGLYPFVSPLISALSSQFDFRPVAMIGLAVSALGFFASSFATSLCEFSIWFGLVGGVGMSIFYLPAIAAVGRWFFRYRARAVGVALCGCGAGTLLAAQVVPRISDWFTWRGTMLITSALCFQGAALAAFFRPIETHLRILQLQHAKHLAKESERREAAVRRIMCERRQLDSRHRKYVANAQLQGAQRHRTQIQPEYLQKHTRKQYGPSGIMNIHALQSKDKMISSHGVLRGTGNRTRMGPAVGKQTHGGRIVAAFNGPPPLMIGLNTGFRQRANQQRRNANKQVPNRRVVVYRGQGPPHVSGSIMQRIIAEKKRQRTISDGSLDGMVITRDNELVAAPKIMDGPLISSSAIIRISESVARKIELKLRQQQHRASNPSIDGQSVVTVTGTPNTPSVGITSSHIGVVASPVRVNLPQLVQDYIQSQLSISVQATQPPSYRHSVSHLGSRAVDANSISSTLHDQYDAPRALTPNNSNVTSQMITDTCSTQVAGPDAAVFTTVATSNLSNSSLSRRSSSMQRSVSDTRLTTHATQSDEHLNVADLLLDNEIKAVIHNQLRREMASPQYKQDLFFTGSVKQLNSSAKQKAMPSLDPISLFAASQVGGPPSIHPSTQQVDLARRFSAQPSDAGGGDLHASQTSVSIGPGATNTFIPPAPCPAIAHTTAHPSTISFGVEAAESGLNPQYSQQIYYQQIQQIQSSPPCPDVDFAVGPTSPSERSSEVTTSHLSNERLNAVEGDPALGATTAAHNGDESEDEAEMHTDDEDSSDGMVHNNSDDAEDEDEVVDDSDQTREDEEDNQGGRCFPPHPQMWPDPSPCKGVLAEFWNFFNPTRSFLVDLFRPGMLLKPSFIAMLLSSILLNLGMYIPYLMLPDLVSELNWSLTDAGFLISVLSASNIAARLLTIAYIEKNWANLYRWGDCIFLHSGALFLAGVFVFLMTYVRMHYTWLLLVSLLFGFTTGLFVSLRSIIVTDVWGNEYLTNAFGYILLVQGLGAAAGPVLAGLIFDLRLGQLEIPSLLMPSQAIVHESTTMSFYFSGTCLLMAGLSALPLRWLARFDSKPAIYHTQYIPPANAHIRVSQSSAPIEPSNYYQPDAGVVGGGGGIEFTVPAPSGDTADYYTVCTTNTTNLAHHLPDGYISEPIHDIQSVYHQPTAVNPIMDLPSSNTVTLVGATVSPSELGPIVEAGTILPNTLDPSGAVTVDGLVSNAEAILGVGTLVLPSSGLPTQPQTVEVINEPVLETVAEEEEEYLDEGEEDEEVNTDGPSVFHRSTTGETGADGSSLCVQNNKTTRGRRKRKTLCNSQSSQQSSSLSASSETPASSPSQPSS